MKGCAQARKLFGPYWDDEVTQAEREWVERHLAGCDHCREEYDSLARTIEAVASLPRAEVSAGFAERALAAARRASPAPDRLPAQPLTPRWVPVTAVAALVVIALASVAPYLASLRSNGTVASRDVAAPRLLATALPAAPRASSTEAGRAVAARPAAALDSLFDHADDVEFILDPVTLHRGRARAATHAANGVQGEQAVISF